MNTYKATIRDIELLRTAQIIFELQAMDYGNKTKEVEKALFVLRKLSEAISVSKHCKECGNEEMIYVTYK